MADLAAMSESSGFWDALVRATEHLFGKLGAAVFLACCAFFLLPAQGLHAIGLDSGNTLQRMIAGVGLLGSAAACIVSLSIKIGPAIRSTFDAFEARKRFNSIPLESRILLGMIAQFETAVLYAPASMQAVQCLIDREYFEAASTGNDLKVFVRVTGQHLIRENRAELRKLAATNIEMATTIAAEIEEAGRRAQEQGRHAWMGG